MAYKFPNFAKGADGALPVIFSLSGEKLTSDEITLFKNANPLGYILFTRNCKTPAQVRALTDNLRDISGRNCPILIDQEGGRVQRLKSPQWQDFPPCCEFGETSKNDLEQGLSDLRYRTLRIADELIEGGINTNCDPVMDLYVDGAHDVIGDRAFSSDPALVGRLGLSVCRHYLSAGVQPIIKHIPGHGRSMADSHDIAPIIDARADVLRETDFVPFKMIAESDIGAGVWAMPSPVIYSAFDSKNPACVSETVIKNIIREEIGFEGIVISDAIDMGGFDGCGTPAERMMAVLDAGCDIGLHYTGKLTEMREIAESVAKISDKALERLHFAL